jgi:phage terminase small subunit
VKKLSPKQRLFVQKQRLFVHEYLIDLNGTKAAIRAGYSAKAAKVTACKLMKLPAVKRSIGTAMKKREDRLEITADKWLRELALIKFSDVTDYLERDPKTGATRAKRFEDFPPGSSRALESLEEITTVEGRRFKVKLHSKLEASKLIGQHLGFLKDPKIEIPGLERAIYELSDKFLPIVKEREKTRSDEPK